MTPFSLRYATLYDALYTEKDYASESAQVRTLFAKYHQSGLGPKSLHDIACGTGRHLEHLCDSIPQLSGSDISEPMLHLARTRLPESVSLYHAPMQKLLHLPPVDCVICLFDAVCYLASDDELSRMLDGLPLSSGGLLFVEFWHSAAVQQGIDAYRERPFRTADGITGTRCSRSTICSAEEKVTVHYSVTFDGPSVVPQAFEETHTLRYFSVEQVTQLLQAHGYTPRAFLHGYQDIPATKDTWHVLSISEKQGTKN